MSNRTRSSSAFDTEFHVYEPHRAGLPRLRPYFVELWRRREFAAELSKATMRAANSMTVFGQLWLVINPLLLAGVYFMLVQILSGGDREPDFLAHLVAGLFAFYFVSGCITSGAGAVTGGGKLVATMAFPRLLMPLSAVRTAFFRFLPTMIVYFAIHIISGAPWSPVMLVSLYFLGAMVVFSAGAASVFAALQVYFRDTTSFLPYFVRIWLYLSPVLWFPDQISERLPDPLPALAELNPLYSLLGGWTELLVRSEVPEPQLFVAAAAWALFAAVLGGWFFMSRERDFAVRL